jgi:RNA polymerase sigma factor (sigma-70 family)
MTKRALDIDALYRQYGALVRRRVRRFFSDEEADDVLQEVFTRVIARQASFRGDSAPATWLYQITTRHCLNRLRDRTRRDELWTERGGAYWSQPVASADQEARARLAQAWREMDDDLVTIGIYYHLDGLTHERIAELLGCSRRTVGNRLAELHERTRGAK